MQLIACQFWRQIVCNLTVALASFFFFFETIKTFLKIKNLTISGFMLDENALISSFLKIPIFLKLENPNIVFYFSFFISRNWNFKLKSSYMIRSIFFVFTHKKEEINSSRFFDLWSFLILFDISTICNMLFFSNTNIGWLTFICLHDVKKYLS